MPKNTSMTLGKHFDVFIANQIKEGRFASANEAVRAPLRKLKDNEQKVAKLRHTLEEGERSSTTK